MQMIDKVILNFGHNQKCDMPKRVVNPGPRSFEGPASSIQFRILGSQGPMSSMTFQDPGFPGSHVQYTLQDPRFPRSHVRYTF